ncbi:alpha/beta hydrolase [Mycobacterium sp. CBMA293]|uniref:lipase family protein n=2 Tax=Mycolicibacterium TaxID=1866885 RepID=UPI0012DDCB1E|nr:MULTISPECIES: lipase family protein [unclassified Mycolicibacterium]MUL46806.1 alpha/beta hydrolase [Mycolicibacterium sp. CBMA 360]MUL57409.1 alpha/beta hydrolase [Mycolicibacterium sp. CBMA 335]MUL70449.1 alpha/beta hydrolase [Mycolicibacterium sp. CBMA 311]MUL92497.1 alpha/beta hydrolase [Mycolicibacterium sp. CBMA 230]MUM12420.1 alpha/beta hydrolase [Mycolicibacterium sp. CBMA 293]
MRRAVQWGAAIAALLLIAASLPVMWQVGSWALDRLRHGGPGDPVPIRTADLAGTGPGTLISAMTMPALTNSVDGKDLQAARVVYRSTSGDTGAATVVSGSVFTPRGKAPDGGWPVVALAHGTTGIDQPCAPSLSANLLGFVTAVQGLANLGFAVAVADYQGLGAPGVHPYTDNRTAGRNVIDSVRALRHTFRDISTRWGVFGGSQGGGAAWAADEQASTYAPELDLVGAAASVPSADVVGMVDKAGVFDQDKPGTMTKDQQAAFQAIIESLARLHPDLNRDDYRRGAAAKYWRVLSACSGPDVAYRAAAIDALQPNDLAPADQAAADRLRRYLQAWALPQQQLSAPMSVVYSGKDAFLDPEWTKAAIERACALGGTLVWRFQPDGGHGDIDVAGQFGWLAARFKGREAVNGCTTQGAS